MTEQDRDRMQERPGEPLAAGPSTRDDGRGDPAVRAPTTTWRRPGLVTFAAVMMFVLGGFHVLLAISEFASSTWVLSRLDVELFIPILVLWGVIDLVIGGIALFAGASILRGGAFGWVMGWAFAGLGAIRWLFFVPVSPVLAVVVIALDVLVIYGLTKHADYFAEVG
jgi:hypothetical protein